MNVEVRKVANGYLVMPMRDYREQSVCLNYEDVYVFANYDKLAQGLQAILEAQTPEKASWTLEK